MSGFTAGRLMARIPGIAWVGVLVLVVAAAGGYGILISHGRNAALAAIAPAKAQAAASKKAEQRAAVELDARIVTVTRWLHDTVEVPIPAAALHPVTPADTAAAVAALPVLQRRYEGCRAQLVPLLSECATYRLTATKRAADDSTVIATQDAAIAKGLTPRRWSVGATVGYGGTLAADNTGGRRLYTGPSVTVGLTLRIF